MLSGGSGDRLTAHLLADRFPKSCVNVAQAFSCLRFAIWCGLLKNHCHYNIIHCISERSG